MQHRPSPRSRKSSLHFRCHSLLTALRAALACGVLVALYPAEAAAQSEAPRPTEEPHPLSAPAQQFLAAVRASFAAWDLDHDGKLTRLEIEIDMQQPRYTDAAAAALAALKLGATHSNHLPDARTYTLADIDAMQRTLEAGGKLDANFVGFFATGLKKEREVPRQLFANGVPQITDIRQDWTTDCYFLSTVGALAKTDPQALVRLFTPRPDGKFAVAFPGKPPIVVPAPTETELATYSNARDGMWLSILEKAYAIERIKAEPQQASTREPLDSVGFRTGNPKVVELLTGHASREINLPAKSQHPADEHFRQGLRAQFTAAMREHRAVMLGNSHHDYSIVAYDPATDLVTIHNPYDRGGFEGYPDGVKMQRTDGFSTLTLPQLVDYYNYIYIELGNRVG